MLSNVLLLVILKYGSNVGRIILSRMIVVQVKNVLDLSIRAKESSMDVVGLIPALLALICIAGLCCISGEKKE